MLGRLEGLTTNLRETVMTGTGLTDPDEGIREAERRDLEAERKEEPLQERGQVEESPKADEDENVEAKEQ
jgi:hypothetical protein